MNILHIDSSILGDQSVSRRLSAAIVARLRDLDPTASVTYRDVAAEPLPQYSGAVAMGRGLPVEERSTDVATLDRVLDEVFAANVIVIGAPMYNFSLPSQLKTWIDAITVAGKTFSYGADGVKGLLGGRRVIVASARGGFYGSDTPHAALDHQEPYLRGLLGFLGITDLEIIRAEGVKAGPEVREKALQAALAQTAALEAA